MAQGFATIQRNATKADAGYTTLFEKITEMTGGSKQSFSWYKNAVRKAAMDYKKDPKKLIREEKIDNRGNEEEPDENLLRRYAVSGHLYMFEYKAKMRHLPYYDTFPLVYVIKSTPTEFWGANLHYMTPKKRVMAVQRLLEGRIDIPRLCFHKYLIESASLEPGCPRGSDIFPGTMRSTFRINLQEKIFSKIVDFIVTSNGSK